MTDLVNTSKLVQKYLPKQTDIDKILDVIKRKVLKGTHLPLTIKGIQGSYLTSQFFNDLYRYLVQNKLHSKRNTLHKVEALSERFVLLDSLLFKIILDKEKTLLAIPEICADKIIRVPHWNKSSEFTLLTFTTFVPRPKKVKKIFSKFSDTILIPPRLLKFAAI